MKRLLAYSLAILGLVVLRTLAVGLGVPEMLRERYAPSAPTASPETLGMIEAFREVDLEVVWALYKPEIASVTVGFANSFPLTQEQAKRIDTVLNEYGLKLGLEIAIFWFWNERPENGWVVVGCDPGGCVMINIQQQGELVPVPIPDEQWQKYVVSTRWVR